MHLHYTAIQLRGLSSWFRCEAFHRGSAARPFNGDTAVLPSPRSLLTYRLDNSYFGSRRRNGGGSCREWSGRIGGLERVEKAQADGEDLIGDVKVRTKTNEWSAGSRVEKPGDQRFGVRKAGGDALESAGEASSGWQWTLSSVKKSGDSCECRRGDGYTIEKREMALAWGCLSGHGGRFGFEARGTGYRMRWSGYRKMDKYTHLTLVAIVDIECTARRREVREEDSGDHECGVDPWGIFYDGVIIVANSCRHAASAGASGFAMREGKRWVRVLEAMPS
ncbi:hypothetical protein C8R44DRAFT_734994 [Mycena epipterygia]|nr:hypothetical protein C8R44DRAFT_734994 [Mycena epipterygia]